MKENGFTLIELLAVIVILAIIALIATPIVLDIIEDSKESSTKRSAELYLNGVEQAIARYQLNGKEFTSETYYVMENGNICTTPLSNKTCTGEEITVTVDGTKPSSGTIKIEDGAVVLSGTSMNFGDYTVSYDTISKTFTAWEPYKGILCTASTELAITEDDYWSGGGMMSWKDTQVGVLASAGDLYAYGVEYTCELGDGEQRIFYILEDGDTTTLTEGRIAQPGEVSLIMNMNINFNNSSMFIKDAKKNWTKLNSSQISDPTAYQIAATTGKTFDGSEISGLPDFLVTNLYSSALSMGHAGYLTSTEMYSTEYNEDILFAVYNFNGLTVKPKNGWSPYDYSRPVITISKSNLSYEQK